MRLAAVLGRSSRAAQHPPRTHPKGDTVSKKRQAPVPWEPADKARVLVLLKENGGVVRATARQWNAQPGVRRLNEASIRVWINDPAQQPTSLVIDANRERIGVLKSILRRLEQGFDKALEESP